MAREFDTQMTFRVQDDATPRIRSLSEEFRRMSSARETLGIRSERTIQREIDRTMAAYNRLSRSGTLSATEQSRAFEKTQATVSRLRQEMAGAERQQRSWGKAAFAIGSGVVAGAMTLRKPINDQMDYSLHLAELANFAYSKDSVAERTKGKQTIDQAIREALRQGGGTHEQAVGAVEAMLRAGNMQRSEVFKELGNVMMNATANLADAVDMANLQSSIYGFGLNKQDSSLALSATTTAAQHGRAGVGLLAKELPGALSSARSAGFHGREGFAAVPALFQTAAKEAGTPEQGVTNAYNLMADLTSSNLANNAKQLMLKGKDGKTIKGVDFRALARQDAEKGLTPLDTVNRLVDRALAGDSGYQKLTKRLATTKDENARADIEAQRSLIEGQYIAQLFPNQYSGSGFRAYRKNKPYFDKLQHEMLEQFDLPEGQRSAELDYGLIKDEPKMQLQRAENEKFNATNDAISPVSKVLGDVAETGAKLAQEFPGLTTAAAGAAIAIKGLGLAAAAKTGADLLTGRNGGKPGGGVLSKVRGLFGKGSSGLAEGAATAGKAAGMLKWVPFLGEAAMAYQGAQDFPLIDIQRGKDQAAEARARGGEANPEMMALMPQPVGALDALDEIRKWFSGSGQDKTADKTAAAPPAPAAPIVNLTVTLDGREIATAMEQRLDRDGRRK